MLSNNPVPDLSFPFSHLSPLRAPGLFSPAGEKIRSLRELEPPRKVGGDVLRNRCAWRHSRNSARRDQFSLPYRLVPQVSQPELVTHEDQGLLDAHTLTP